MLNKTVLVSNAILSLFSRHGPYFHPTKDRCSSRLSSPFFYICCNFGQIFCTEVIQLFSVANMGHQELKKSSKYELVIFLDERPRFTFANFLHLFIQGSSLTHSALVSELFLFSLYALSSPCWDFFFREFQFYVKITIRTSHQNLIRR